MVQVLETAGFRRRRWSRQQEQPDPDFPTVAFPNPEEPGAMDLALALAAAIGADIVVANDPDADRCAAAIPGPDGWRMLRGDEVGALLATYLLQPRQARHIRDLDRVVLAARQAGRGRAASSTSRRSPASSGSAGSPELAFGYEEALGYCVDPELVRDKDGVSALLLLCELAAEAKAAGRGLQDLLDDIAVEHGLHATDQVSVRVSDLARSRPRWPGSAEAPPAASAASRSSASRTSAWAPTRCLRPTACATTSPTGRG